jgi:hypothetical protein
MSIFKSSDYSNDFLGTCDTWLANVLKNATGTKHDRSLAGVCYGAHAEGMRYHKSTRSIAVARYIVHLLLMVQSPLGWHAQNKGWVSITWLLFLSDATCLR